MEDFDELEDLDIMKYCAICECLLCEECGKCPHGEFPFRCTCEEKNEDHG